MAGDFGLTRMTMSIFRAHQRDVERQRKYEHKMQLLQTADDEVEEQEKYIETLKSLHKKCAPETDWQVIAIQKPPLQPVRTNDAEIAARERREKYVPNFFIKLLNLTKYRIKQLENDIIRAVDEDQAKYDQAVTDFKEQQSEWEFETALAKNILKGDPESYRNIIKDLELWSDLEKTGELLLIEIRDSDKIEVSIKYDKDCVPKHRKRALKRGDVSLTNMPISLYNDICYAYVCSAAIRVIREIFAALPVNSVQINIIGDFVNALNGNPEQHPILSVRVPRESLKDINWSNIDSTNFIQQFTHRMNFKKTKGFGAVLKVS